ncbi:MAG: arginine repressor [Galactobacter sp.]|uniref:arginine repressor n=1 Tax=Galactobacter sp. TaxID=2676125 RepID=UPI0025BBBE99|nr:arginine repressor [Galactobacter sp.]
MSQNPSSPRPVGGTPSTKVARQGRIRAVLASRAVRSQADLADALAAEGIQVTQGTLSRDLVEMGATRVRDADGISVYALREDDDGLGSAPLQADGELLDPRLTRLCSELLISAEASANLVVLHTPPGAANFLAGAIDHSVIPTVLGSIAGDDTVVVVAKDPDGGDEVAARFLAWADGLD